MIQFMAMSWLIYLMVTMVDIDSWICMMMMTLEVMMSCVMEEERIL
jgi:hypothetical protein